MRRNAAETGRGRRGAEARRKENSGCLILTQGPVDGFMPRGTGRRKKGSAVGAVASCDFPQPKWRDQEASSPAAKVFHGPQW